MNKNKTSDEKQNRVVFLKGKTTVLRPVSDNDVPLLTKWINDPRVRRFIKSIFPRTDGFERDWVAELKKKSETDVVLIIEVRGKAIGVMGLHRIDWKNRVGTTGAIIGEPRFWSKGYGTDAKMALLDYAFNTLNLRKIISKVKSFNERSLAYSKKCGYKVEGRLREQHFVDGKYWDEVILAVFREDWLPCWKKYMAS